MYHDINGQREWFAMHGAALMKTSISRFGKIGNGFTLLEMMIVVGIFSLVIAGTINVYIMCQKIWHSTSLKMQTVQDGSLAMARMVYGIGTNCGLRAAAGITVGNMRGYCTSGNYPLPANSSDHYLTAGTPNGSWRITYSNSFDGVKWIDYNTAASNIVFWPDINSSSSRQLICNYVSGAAVSNTSGGLSVSITVARNEGRFSATNQLDTFVEIRND